jgi:RNA polymerase sigma-70 factor (ECF subfamily)
MQFAEQAARLRQALAHLPPQQAAVFCMRMLDDLSYEQIAEALGISASHVGVLLYRARGALRERFADRDKAGKTQVHYD